METPHHLQNISEISTDTLVNSEVTPEKLAIMKLRDSYLNSDFLSEPGTPIGMRKSFDFSNSNGVARSSSRARSSRQISTSTRRSSTLGNSHSSKMSLEISRQAEGKFFALMDLVSSASREASSLKEFWSSMISERESLAREREELIEQITEVSETLERKESEHHHHGEELGERKKQVEKLLLDLTGALTTISEHKRRAIDRDHELSRARTELRDLRDSTSRTSITYEKVKADFEALEMKFKAAEDERDHARKNGEKSQDELRSLIREHTELKSKSTETTFKLETVRKEVISFADRLKTSEMERDNLVVEKDRLQELLRKSNIKSDEASLELVELTEKHEHQLRDIHKAKETIRDLETDVDKYSSSVDHMRREIKTKTTIAEEAEARLSETTFKFDHLKRDNTLTKEKLEALELERTEQHEIIERSREEARAYMIEKIQLKDDMEMWRHRAGDHHRLVNTLQETARKTESSLVEVRSEVHTLTDRLSHAERERSEVRDKNDHLNTEVTQLKEKIVMVQAELRMTSESRDRLRDELHEHKQRYEEVTETMTDFRDSSGGYEFEIENLRSMLRDARDQKERAITARNAADRERDEYMARYEEKCREMERFEQSASSHFHAQARSEGRSMTSRVVSRANTSGTAVHHGNGDGSEEHQE